MTANWRGFVTGDAALDSAGFLIARFPPPSELPVPASYRMPGNSPIQRSSKPRPFLRFLPGGGADFQASGVFDARFPRIGNRNAAIRLDTVMKKKKLNERLRHASTAERADVATVKALEPWLRNPLARAAGAVGHIGDEPPVLALSGAVMAAGLWRRDRRLTQAGGGMVAAHLLAIAIKTFGKNHVDRTRPDALIDENEYEMKKGHSRKDALRSFPSGHTAGAVAVARAAAREYPEHRWPIYGAAALVGALQVPRRAHFPTDVLAGALVGLVAEQLVHGAARALRRAQGAGGQRGSAQPVRRSPSTKSSTAIG